MFFQKAFKRLLCSLIAVCRILIIEVALEPFAFWERQFNSGCDNLAHYGLRNVFANVGRQPDVVLHLFQF